MTAQKTKLSKVYYDNEGKWIYRMVSRDEYMRKDQIRSLESGKIPKLVYDSTEKSPYYTDTNCPYFDEKKLIPTKENESSYQQQRVKNRGFRRAIVNSGVPRKDKIYSELNPFYKPLGEYDTTLVFESRFESGNLKRAMLVDDNEYDLLMQSDHNSPGYSQWYYFKISNTRANTRYTFNLSNFYKPESLYNCGMKPLMYSTKKAKNDGVGWSRIGEDIWYYQNWVKRKAMVGFLYTLSFSFELPYDNDEVYFCHSFPYTYRDCKDHLDSIWVDIRKIRKTELWKSLAENSLDLVIVTNFESSDQDIAQREAVIITGRIHPGETNSSFIVEGILDFLVSEIEEAKQLRDKYVFKIIPILNPDGVVIGNYRCSLSGQDLNRQWIGATSRVFPEIYYTKHMFRKTLDSRKVFLYIDIHGHSRKKNAFIYGWHNKGTDKKNHEKIFPLLYSKSHPSFSFEECNFNIQKDKEGTGRVVVRREYAVINSFTLEVSMFGPDKGPYKDWHYTPNQLKDIGKSFWLALNDMDDTKSKASLLKQLESMLINSNGWSNI